MGGAHSGVWWLEWAYAGFTLFGEHVRWADLIGNIAALATVALAVRRSMWTWPVQLTGAVLLFAVSIDAHLTGNALKQIMFVGLVVYGWTRWARATRGGAELRVRPATGHERGVLLGLLVGGTVAVALLFEATGLSWAPWPDAFIFVGSAVATFGQSRALIDFWFVWIAVDLVGVPLALMSGLWVTGAVYIVFFVLAVIGIRDWMRRHRAAEAAEAAGAVGSAGAAGPTGPDEASGREAVA
ncbi:nicotinamide riboside transporter PnuC [Nocardiopsis sp. RSe5-2]|uniref:Nicotinamide riboside transporter PnuC n=1 Tax=Nocardiopsis endophytica TaxID=3018445 RepID=A0ABT4U9P6_9ACTN|nr:nicotinamide riboside transporter PnuC [Nocardiopsis endophytica]MDA2813689.1 nicotinamide riboside transporter PnuC [Nocardiopsis endophytica]